jgi:hypothetical protein
VYDSTATAIQNTELLVLRKFDFQQILKQTHLFETTQLVWCRAMLLCVFCPCQCMVRFVDDPGVCVDLARVFLFLLSDPSDPLSAQYALVFNVDKAAYRPADDHPCSRDRHSWACFDAPGQPA